MKKKIVIILFLFSFVFVKGQITKNTFYTLSLGEGYVLPTNDFLKGINKDNKKITNITNISLRMSKEVDNSLAWHTLYNDFRYGIGAYLGVFNYSKNLGNPFAVYVFAGFSPWKYKSFTLKNELALGLSGIWDYYSKTNRENIAVSLPIEVYAHWNLEGYWLIKDNWQLGTGFSFTHFSNGALVKPNKGINTLSPILSLAYIPKPIVKENLVFEQEEKQDFHFEINNWAGVHAVHLDYTNEDNTRDTIQKSYLVFGGQYKLTYELNNKYGIGLGGEWVYSDATWKADTTHYKQQDYKKLSTMDKVSLGLILSFHYNVNDFSILVEPGYAIRQKHGYASKFYQRLGLRYYAYKGLFAQVALRAYSFHVADYIEWGLGYRF